MPGPPLVLLHGFTQTGRSWAGVSAALGERYRSFAPDLPGHGDAAFRRPATIGACTAYLAALPYATFTLAGYSMGGRVALATALALPARVTRLILVSASPGIADPAERRQRVESDEQLARRIEEVGVAEFALEWSRHPLFAGMPRAAAERAHQERLRQTAEGLAASLRGMGTGAMEPLWERLGELAMPVSVVAGERDAKFRALAEQMAARIPDAKLVVVPSAGHAVHLEAPASVAAAINAG